MTTSPSADASDSGAPLVVAIVGPTASGKTALAIALSAALQQARGIQSEAISADSRQVYRRMDIATAKPTPEERAALPHYLLDVVDPDESYTLAQYQAGAIDALRGIFARGHLPLLVGGTGLYVRAVVDGLAIPEVAPQPELRAALEAELASAGLDPLVRRLAELDPAGVAHIDTANPRRVLRALEVSIVTGRPFSEQRGARPTPYRTRLIGLNMDRAALYARADRRIDAMLAAGLLEETRALVAAGYDWTLPSMSSLGYREIGAYLRGEVTLAQAIERFKLDTHAYIRRQLTWFRPDTRITWLDAALPVAELAQQASGIVTAALDEA